MTRKQVLAPKSREVAIIQIDKGLAKLEEFKNKIDDKKIKSEVYQLQKTLQEIKEFEQKINLKQKQKKTVMFKILKFLRYVTLIMSFSIVILVVSFVISATSMAGAEYVLKNISVSGLSMLDRFTGYAKSNLFTATFCLVFFITALITAYVTAEYFLSALKKEKSYHVSDDEREIYLRVQGRAEKSASLLVKSLEVKSLEYNTPIGSCMGDFEKCKVRGNSFCLVLLAFCIIEKMLPKLPNINIGSKG